MALVPKKKKILVIASISIFVIIILIGGGIGIAYALSSGKTPVSPSSPSSPSSPDTPIFPSSPSSTDTVVPVDCDENLYRYLDVDANVCVSCENGEFVTTAEDGTKSCVTCGIDDDGNPQMFDTTTESCRTCDTSSEYYEDEICKTYCLEGENCDSLNKCIEGTTRTNVITGDNLNICCPDDGKYYKTTENTDGTYSCISLIPDGEANYSSSDLTEILYDSEECTSSEYIFSSLPFENGDIGGCCKENTDWTTESGCCDKNSDGTSNYIIDENNNTTTCCGSNIASYSINSDKTSFDVCCDPSQRADSGECCITSVINGTCSSQCGDTKCEEGVDCGLTSPENSKNVCLTQGGTTCGSHTYQNFDDYTCTSNNEPCSNDNIYLDGTSTKCCTGNDNVTTYGYEENDILHGNSPSCCANSQYITPSTSGQTYCCSTGKIPINGSTECCTVNNIEDGLGSNGITCCDKIDDNQKCCDNSNESLVEFSSDNGGTIKLCATECGNARCPRDNYNCLTSTFTTNISTSTKQAIWSGISNTCETSGNCYCNNTEITSETLFLNNCFDDSTNNLHMCVKTNNDTCQPTDSISSYSPGTILDNFDNDLNYYPYSNVLSASGECTSNEINLTQFGSYDTNGDTQCSDADDSLYWGDGGYRLEQRKMNANCDQVTGTLRCAELMTSTDSRDDTHAIIYNQNGYCTKVAKYNSEGGDQAGYEPLKGYTKYEDNSIRENTCSDVYGNGKICNSFTSDDDRQYCLVAPGLQRCIEPVAKNTVGDNYFYWSEQGYQGDDDDSTINLTTFSDRLYGGEAPSMTVSSSTLNGETSSTQRFTCMDKNQILLNSSIQGPCPHDVKSVSWSDNISLSNKMLTKESEDTGCRILLNRTPLFATIEYRHNDNNGTQIKETSPYTNSDVNAGASIYWKGGADIDMVCGKVRIWANEDGGKYGNEERLHFKEIPESNGDTGDLNSISAVQFRPNTSKPSDGNWKSKTCASNNAKAYMIKSIEDTAYTVFNPIKTDGTYYTENGNPNPIDYAIFVSDQYYKNIYEKPGNDDTGGYYNPPGANETDVGAINIIRVSQMSKTQFISSGVRNFYRDTKGYTITDMIDRFPGTDYTYWNNLGFDS